MKRKKGALACSDCGQRNYKMTPTQAGAAKRLEVNKFCKHCRKHTLHKQTQ